MERLRIVEKPGGRYFEKPPTVSCIPTGCRTLDRVLGNGWAEGRYGNIIGDKSTGKTLLSIESCANFAIKYPTANKAFIRYAECEAAFDIPYAEAVGLPLDRVQFNKTGQPIDTVEAWHKDLDTFLLGCEKHKAKAGLYILDSLDSIGDEYEKESDFGKDSFGGKKPKLIGQLFRREVRRIAALNVTMLIVSQVRDKIGVTFGDKLTRSGGKPLDFYASQILWLANKGQIEETRQGVKRKVGVCIGAKCKKNKIGLAFRECDFIIRYGYGIDEFESCLQWLIDVKATDKLGLTVDSVKKYLKLLDKMAPAEIVKAREKLNTAVDSVWQEIENRFLPLRKKYV